MGNPAHNISQDDQYTVFQIARVKNLKEKAESATGEYSSALGRLEANGLEKWAVKEALKIQKKGASEVTAYVNKLQKLFKYLGLLNLPIEDSQLEMFQTASAAEPEVDRAWRAGVLVGAMGEGMDHNNYSPESDQGQAWLKGYHEGSKNYQQFQIDEAEEERDELIPGDEDENDGSQADIEDDVPSETEDEE